MKTHCVKCRKDAENIDLKIVITKKCSLCNQNVLFVESKNQDL